jgi:hypothetical protein
MEESSFAFNSNEVFELIYNSFPASIVCEVLEVEALEDDSEVGTDLFVEVVFDLGFNAGSVLSLGSPVAVPALEVAFG